MITVTQARENDRTTFCRQFTFNKNGYSNREVDGAVVSGVPVSGVPISSLPIGSKIALTDPEKLSPGEVGYIVCQSSDEILYLVPDAHRKRGNFASALSVAQSAVSDMTEKARAIVTTVRGMLTSRELKGGLPFFNSDESRSFWNRYWIDWNSSSIGLPSNVEIYCPASGGPIATTNREAETVSLGIRGLYSIPSSTLVSSQPNAAGAYELI